MLLSAQVWVSPALIAVTPLLKPLTAIGLMSQARPEQFSGPVVPSPSWPFPLKPQHSAAPVLFSAQVCWVSAPVPAEALIAVTPLPRPLTATAVDLSVVVPSPTAPVVFSPQHSAAPVLPTAHACQPPT